MTRTKTSSLKLTGWIATLILSLMFAQLSGLQHRVEHARWQVGQDLSKQDVRLFTTSANPLSDNSKQKSSHSCSVFDASTLADAFGATPCTPVFANVPNTMQQSVAIASWHVPFVFHFLSRAPPSVVISTFQ